MTPGELVDHIHQGVQAAVGVSLGFCKLLDDSLVARLMLDYERHRLFDVRSKNITFCRFESGRQANLSFSSCLVQPLFSRTVCFALNPFYRSLRSDFRRVDFAADWNNLLESKPPWPLAVDG